MAPTNFQSFLFYLKSSRAILLTELLWSLTTGLCLTELVGGWPCFQGLILGPRDPWGILRTGSSLWVWPVGKAATQPWA